MTNFFWPGRAPSETCRPLALEMRKLGNYELGMRIFIYILYIIYIYDRSSPFRPKSALIGEINRGVLKVLIWEIGVAGRTNPKEMRKDFWKNKLNNLLKIRLKYVGDILKRINFSQNIFVTQIKSCLFFLLFAAKIPPESPGRQFESKNTASVISQENSHENRIFPRVFYI